MEGKLKELTQKIYAEGLEKAQKEGQMIIRKAEEEANKILEKAKKDAEQMIKKAEQEAEQLRQRTLSEVKMASEQAMASLRQEITRLVVESVIKPSLKETLSDENVVGEVILTLARHWSNEEGRFDITVVLPEKHKEKLLAWFKAKAAALLEKGLDIQFESRMEGGFRIVPKDGSFVLSFTEKDFAEFFQSFLKPQAKEMLFGGK
ncbi:V-type ATP synthase subunit E [Brevinematales bacterium NS]|nr:V-type ATP synthase subunit E [Brevinematales bacterium]QJR22126.1 V-type ATP synthase subunit E [Brevinematales bacterium NS]